MAGWDFYPTAEGTLPEAGGWRHYPPQASRAVRARVAGCRGHLARGRGMAALPAPRADSLSTSA